MTEPRCLIGANNSQCLFPDCFAAVGKWLRRCLIFPRLATLSVVMIAGRKSRSMLGTFGSALGFTVVTGATPRHEGHQTMTAPAHPPELGPLLLIFAKEEPHDDHHHYRL